MSSSGETMLVLLFLLCSSFCLWGSWLPFIPYLLCIFTIEGIFHLFGCILFVLFLMSSQSCITLVISNWYFVVCFYALVDHWHYLVLVHSLSVINLSFYSRWPIHTLRYSISDIFRLDPKITVPCETNISVLVPAIHFPMRCNCSSTQLFFFPQNTATSIH